MNAYGSNLKGLLVICSPSVILVMLVAFLVLGCLVYFYAPYWAVRKVPGPPTALILGHLPLLSKYGPDVMRLLAKEYGPIFRFHMGRRPLIVIADPDLCRDVGIKKFKKLRNRSIPFPASGSPLHMEGLFLSRDLRWSQMRNTLISVYQPIHLATLIPSMQSYIETLSMVISNKCQREEGTIIFSDLSLRLAIDIIGNTAFGIEFKLLRDLTDYDEKDDNDHDAMMLLKEYTYSMESLKMDLSSSFSTVIGLFLPALQKPVREVLRWLPWVADFKINQTNRNLCQRIDSIIARRMRSKMESRDFIASIMSVGDLLSHSNIQALSYEQLLAGTKTTAFTLTMIVYLVSTHPEVQGKLLYEIDRFVPCDQVPTADDLRSKFPYLDQVIKESMRFETVSPLVARETSEQVEIHGYILPKGTWVWLALGVLAKDPRHFPEPDMFRPERFDPNGDEEKGRHPYVHIPFGIGPRACIGQKFALQQLKLALIHLYRNYVFEIDPKMKGVPEFDYGLVLGFKNSVKLRAIKRSMYLP